MNLQQIKKWTCALDRGEAILLVDIETETIPLTDASGNKLYYCLEGHHTFAVKQDKKMPIQERGDKELA